VRQASSMASQGCRALKLNSLEARESPQFRGFSASPGPRHGRARREPRSCAAAMPPHVDAADLLRHECSPKVLNLPGSRRTCNAICSMRGLNTRTSRSSQRSTPAAQVLRRHRVIRLGDFDVAVAADDPLRLVKEGEPRGRQRQEGRLLGLAKHLAHVSLGGAVNPCVGDVLFPLRQMLVLASSVGTRVPSGRYLAHSPRPAAEVYLDLLARRALHPPHGQRRTAPNPQQTPHTVVAPTTCGGASAPAGRRG